MEVLNKMMELDSCYYEEYFNEWLDFIMSPNIDILNMFFEREQEFGDK